MSCKRLAIYLISLAFSAIIQIETFATPKVCIITHENLETMDPELINVIDKANSLNTMDITDTHFINYIKDPWDNHTNKVLYALLKQSDYYGYKFDNQEVCLIKIKGLYTDNLGGAIDTAYSKGCRIIVNTFNFSGQDGDEGNITLYEALSEKCVQYPDLIILQSAGNDNKELKYNIYKPNNMFIVGACDNDNHITGFSNYGENVDIYSLGDKLIYYSVLDNPTDVYLRGTSFAAPTLASIILRLFDDVKELNSQNVKQYLLTNMVEYPLNDPKVIKDEYFSHIRELNP